MVINDKKKIFRGYELSGNYIKDFLFMEKIKSALYNYNPENSIVDSDLFVKISYNRYDMINMAILYYIVLSIDGNNRYLKIIKSILEYEGISESCAIHEYEYRFLESFDKIPFNFQIKKIQDEYQLKSIFNFIGVGILSNSLLSWIYCDFYASRNFDDYIEEFSEIILEEYYDNELSFVCNFIDFDYSRMPKNNLKLLLSEYWGFEFNLLSIESKELDGYIDSIIDYDVDLNSLKTIIESIYTNLAPEPFRISNAYIIDSSNPLFDMFGPKDCKYRIISLSIKRAYTNWEYSDYILDGFKVKKLIHDIDKLNQVIISN